MREPEYRRKNLLKKGREITQQDLNKGHHGRKVSATLRNRFDDITSGITLMEASACTIHVP